MSVPLRRGSVNLCGLSGHEAGKESVSSVSVLLAQPAKSDAVWRVRLEAETPDGRHVVGSWLTSNPQAGAPTNRVIAMATVPGAFAWFVTVTYVSGTVANTELIGLAAADCCAELGLVVLDGPNATPGAGPAGTFDTLAVVGAGALVVPAGAKVTGIVGWASASGATIKIGAAGVADPVPTGGVLELEPPEGTLRGPVTITFTGTDGGVVELVK